MEAVVHSADRTYESVTRWRRNGEDSLYVEPLGRWDLLTGVGHPRTPEAGPLLEAVARAWLADHEPARPARAVLRQVTPLPPEDRVEAPRRALVEAPEAPDLLVNRAGQQLLAREQAEVAAGRSPGRRFFGLVLNPSSWVVGAQGEQLVAEKLRELCAQDPRWGFLNSIQVSEKGTDIDHLVVGPGGVFTLNTKHHRDARIWVGGDMVMVNGQKTWYVRNARHEAARAARKLSAAVGAPVSVTGVVVPVGASSLTVATGPADVRVVNRRRLAPFFRDLPDVLTKDEVMDVFAAARDGGTWLGRR